MHVDSMRFNSTKSVHLKKIVIRVAFLRLMYAVVCSIVNVMIENIKIKTMFDSEAEINCIFKRLADVVQLFVHQSINMIIINVIDERARFFSMCETVLINIENITISILVFVMKRSDHGLLFKKILSMCCSYEFYQYEWWIIWDDLIFFEWKETSELFKDAC